MALLFADLVLPVEIASIRPLFDSLAVLEVVEPLAFIAGPVGVYEYSSALSLVVDPLSVVEVAVDMNESAPAVGLTEPKVAFVLRAVLLNN